MKTSDERKFCEMTQNLVGKRDFALIAIPTAIPLAIRQMEAIPMERHHLE